MTLYEIEKKAILEVFEANNQNRTRTAKELNIGMRTLQRKLEAYGIPKGEYGTSKWSDSAIRQDASKYNTLREWYTQGHKSYQAAVARGILKNIKTERGW